jgi:lipopolysaccharide export LptBFGC system permease protein LptF
MNKWLYFVGGLVLGVCLTVTILYFLSSSSPVPKANQDAETLISQAKEENEVEDNRDGVTIFEEAGDIINEKSIKVFQVIAEDAALANGDTELIGGTSLKGMYAGPVYAIVSKQKNAYYDDQIIKLPKGKVFRQIGVYKYPTQKDVIKTVPIIAIMDN